ncbi:MAG TPA: class I SAM-dependent methyltransferase [Candidatus Nanoarchaeia archaeon]|nr:class I SAM-dependent methyltransferase [Candidatus Nanoarchaeia archaeon]
MSTKETNSPACRFCGEPLTHTFVDLGMQPLCESYVTADQLNHMEPFYPLHVRVCDNCYLVQLEEYVSPKEIFSEYAYFSSYSEAWLKHAKNYVDMITTRLRLSEKSLVVEIASNDGYLLQFFAKHGVPVLGIEPAANVAEVAIKKDIPTIVDFFNLELANAMIKKGQSADLIVGNNVLAQVTDLNGFVESMKILLKPSGVITMEFPHLMNLIEENQFDTIYHEHFSYFSLLTVEKIFEAHGLTIFDVDELNTHGGSLRIYACHKTDASKPTTTTLVELRKKEKQKGYEKLETYSTFDEKVRSTKRNLLDYLIHLKRDKKKIAGYGAPGKGNTLLNYCGIRSDFLDFTVDRNPYKQGRFLPGTHIPILPPEQIEKTKPDYVFILPWNIKDEIMTQLSYIKDWGGKFIVPIPEVKIFDPSKKDFPARKHEVEQ